MLKLACHRTLRFNDVLFKFAPQPHEVTALHTAVEQDNNGIIQLLLSRKEINVNACDEVSENNLKLTFAFTYMYVWDQWTM